MSGLNFKVSADKCVSCNSCVHDCPARIIKNVQGGIPHIEPESEANCLQCQHCLAICPVGAISIFGIQPEECIPLKEGSLPDYEHVTRLLRGRRSVRQFLPRNVEPALIRDMLATVANCPTAVNTRKLRFSLISDRAVLQKLLGQCIKWLEKAREAGQLDPASYLAKSIDTYRKYNIDTLFRGAPHALIVSAGPGSVCPAEDVNIALSYFELLAQSAGMGTVWCGLMKHALELVPELKEPLRLEGQSYYYCMVFGRPAIRYARTVKRDNAAEVCEIGGDAI